jgi:hypothetical protein
VSAVPEAFMRDPPKPQDRAQQHRAAEEESARETFWQWFAVGVLLLCWVAEATLCTQSGF